MKISSLIPDVREDSFGNDRIINYMLIRMAEKIDYLEAIIKAQKEEIKRLSCLISARSD